MQEVGCTAARNSLQGVFAALVHACRKYGTHHTQAGTWACQQHIPRPFPIITSSTLMPTATPCCFRQSTKVRPSEADWPRVSLNRMAPLMLDPMGAV